MAREFQRSLEQAADESGMSEVSKNLRALDQSLHSATDSARKFAMRPLADDAAKPKVTPKTAPATAPETAAAPAAAELGAPPAPEGEQAAG